MESREILLDADTIIPAEELCSRIGEGDIAFVGRLKEGNFTILFSSKPPRTNGSKVYYLCTTGTVNNIYCGDGYGFKEYNFEDVFIYRREYENYKNDGREYLDWPTCKDGEWIPADEARKLLGITPREFRRILDNGELETDKDEEREESLCAWNNDNTTFGSFSFFDRSNICNTTVNRISLSRYAENHNITLCLAINNQQDQISLVGSTLVKEKEKFERWFRWYKKKASELEAKLKEIETAQTQNESPEKEEVPKTANATICRLKNRIQELIDGYEGAAKLASEIGRRGTKNGNPWSEAEILDLAEELGVSIKGDCLKAFKAGMPADLVKKDAGARPITPREESPDDVES